MKAFIECGKCKKQSEVNFIGAMKCPHCGNDSHFTYVDIGHGKPAWFIDEHSENKIESGRK